MDIKKINEFRNVAFINGKSFTKSDLVEFLKGCDVSYPKRVFSHLLSNKIFETSGKGLYKFKGDPIHHLMVEAGMKLGKESARKHQRTYQANKKQKMSEIVEEPQGLKDTPVVDDPTYLVDQAIQTLNDLGYVVRLKNSWTTEELLLIMENYHKHCLKHGATSVIEWLQNYK